MMQVISHVKSRKGHDAIRTRDVQNNGHIVAQECASWNKSHSSYDIVFLFANHWYVREKLITNDKCFHMATSTPSLLPRTFTSHDLN